MASTSNLASPSPLRQRAATQPLSTEPHGDPDGQRQPRTDSGNSANNLNNPYRRHQKFPAPHLQWHNKIDAKSEKQGRVLIIEYVKADYSKEATHRVSTVEISNLQQLRRFYSEAKPDCILRVVHVQNADWAVIFLRRKLNVQQSDSIVGTDFGEALRRRYPTGRSVKQSAKAWKAQHDPFRGISRTALSLDCMRSYPLPKVKTDPNATQANIAAMNRDKERLMLLNAYDTDGVTRPSYQVFSQRLSVYVQHKDSSQVTYDVGDVENPYEPSWGSSDQKNYLPKVEYLDNCSTIVIFETSQSGSVHDTLVAARKEWESRWRRLPFYLAFESVDLSDNDKMAIECMKVIVSDIVRSVLENWESLFELAENHMTILEDKIYASPSDETRAPELWTNNYNWMKMEKLVMMQQDAVLQFSNYLIDLLNFNSDYNDQTNWLPNSSLDWARISNFVREGLVQPNNSLVDLVYKSTAFRDSRLNLELSTSMWRLSWISVLFLPLTFVASVFGMNVTLINAERTNISWYFIVTVPLMVLVLTGWYVAKHILRSQLQNFETRSVYSSLFTDLASSYPTLWTQDGPMFYVRGLSFISNIKWSLIKLWTDPEKTIHAGEDVLLDDAAGLGRLSQLKRTWIRAWTKQIADQAQHPLRTKIGTGKDSDSAFTLADEEHSAAIPHSLTAGLGVTTDLLVRTAEPAPVALDVAEAHGQHGHLRPVVAFASQGDSPKMRIARDSRPTSSHSEKSKRSSGGFDWLTEERGPSWFGGPSHFLQNVGPGRGGPWGKGMGSTSRSRSRSRSDDEDGVGRPRPSFEEVIASGKENEKVAADGEVGTNSAAEKKEPAEQK